MNNQRLIDEIVTELYNKLQKDSLCSSIKPKLVLIKSPNIETKELEEIYEVVNYREEITMCESIVIGKMSIELLSHLALGCSHNKEEAFILKHLLQGKKVYMLDKGIEYRSYKKSSYKALYQLYSDYENKIKQYGIKTILQLTDIVIGQEKSVCNLETIETEEHEKLDFTLKKLLLESDLMRAHIPALGTILINKKCIVTPLADDFIRTHKLKIKRV